MLEILGAKAPLAGIYANGHGPDSLPNSWRKPGPGMLLAAATYLNLDLSHSLLIVDRLSDLQAGIRAGLPWFAHVLNGYGVKESKIVEKWFIQSRNSIGERYNFELLLLNSLYDFPFSRFACF